MTQVAPAETPAINLPVDLVSVDGSPPSFRARWRDDADTPHELTIALDGAGDVEHLQALLRCCYEAGFADASNPRFFVP